MISSHFFFKLHNNNYNNIVLLFIHTVRVNEPTINTVHIIIVIFLCQFIFNIIEHTLIIIMERIHDIWIWMSFSRSPDRDYLIQIFSHEIRTVAVEMPLTTQKKKKEVKT